MPNLSDTHLELPARAVQDVKKKTKKQTFRHVAYGCEKHEFQLKKRRSLGTRHMSAVPLAPIGTAYQAQLRADWVLMAP